MKINIYIITLVLVIFSCESDDSRPTVTLDSGVDISLITTSISTLDENIDMELGVVTQNLDINGLVITDSDGGNSQDLSISDGKAIFNSSVFGSLANKEEEALALDAALSNGVSYQKMYDVTITNPIIISQSLDNLTYKSSVQDTLAVKTSTESATIDMLSLEWKVGKEGTYQTDTNFSPLTIANDTIFFTNVDETTNGYGLKLNDTLYYRMIATSGALSDSLEIALPVLTQPYSVDGTGTIGSSLTANKFDLGNGVSYPDLNIADGEIKSDNTGVITKEGETDIVFAAVTDISGTAYADNSELLAAKDALTSKELFEANAEITSFKPSAPDQLFAYKITRDDVTTYGLILVNEIVNTDSDSSSDVAYNFTYGEGVVK